MKVKLSERCDFSTAAASGPSMGPTAPQSNPFCRPVEHCLTAAPATRNQNGLWRLPEETPDEWQTSEPLETDDYRRQPPKRQPALAQRLYQLEPESTTRFA